MKALKFLGNRVEDAANAFIDVLKYSDQSVDYPDFKDIEPWPEDIVNMFKDALKDKPFSEISAILMYTQKENMRDARNNGKLRGSSCKASRSKLSKSDLAKIFRLKSKGLYYIIKI